MPSRKENVEEKRGKRKKDWLEEKDGEEGERREVVDYAQGLPLALITFGCSFGNCNRKEGWEDELNKLKKFPYEKIQKVLRPSYDRLEANEKELFLDIACHYDGMDIESAERMLTIRGISAAGIRNLVDMSLVSISTTNCIKMHDLLRKMGRAIFLEKHSGKGNKKMKNTDTLVEWTFLLVALCLEIFSIACDQASSPSRPRYALVGMLLAIAALLTGISELIYKGKKERVIRRRWWFYYPPPGRRPFGTLPEIYGLLGGIAQCFFSTVQYVFFIRHAENPIKVSLWPAILLVCLGAARMSKNRIEALDEHED